MKKALSLILILVVFGFVGCDNKYDETKTEAPPAAPSGMGLGTASTTRPTFNPSTLEANFPGAVTIGGSDLMSIDTNGDGTEDIGTNSGGDLIFANDGKGVIMTNAAGTVSKRVRLNDAGDGLIFEDE